MTLLNSVFFFNDTATTEIYTLSLHDALPIFLTPARPLRLVGPERRRVFQHQRAHQLRASYADGQRDRAAQRVADHDRPRSEEHTSELQSRQYLVCRLLLEKKKTTNLH